VLTSYSGNVVCTVRLKGLLHSIPLTRVGSVVTSGVRVVAKIDGHIDFGLLDSFQLGIRSAISSLTKSREDAYHKGRDVTIRTIQTDARGKLRHQLDILNDVRQRAIAVRVLDIVGGISQSVERVFQSRIFLERAWIVWICLVHSTVRRVTSTIVGRQVIRALLVAL
jgi:hypothetical protein